MKNLFQLVFLLSFVFLAGCEKEILFEEQEEQKPDPVVVPENLESAIRRKFDGIAVFTWDQYDRLLTKLSEDKFLVLPLNEMRTTYNSSKVVVALRHDVDLNIFKAVEMAKMEKAHSIRSTFYLLATAEYFGKIDSLGLKRHTEIPHLVQAIHETGSEIGIHNDLLSVMMIYHLDPMKFNIDELSFYNSLKVPVYGSAAHGSSLGKVIKISCFQIFSEFAKTPTIEYLGKQYPLGQYSMRDYGFQYEAYAIDFGFYYSDSGGDWHDPEGFEGILKKLDASKPGDRVQILAHPDWYGKTW